MFDRFKKKDVPKAQPATPVDPSIKYEKNLHEMRSRISKIDEDMERIDLKVSQIDTQIRELISQNKKQQAKGKIAEMKGYQKQIESYQTKRNMLTQLVIQIESLEQDIGMTSVIKDAAELTKEQQKANDQLQDAMLDLGEFQTSQQETQELWKQMANMGVDAEELDNEFAQYEQQVNAQQQTNLNNQFSKVPAQQIQQPVQQQVQQSTYSQQDQNFQKSLQSMLD